MRLATSSWSVAASLMLSCAQPAQHEHCARSTDVCAASTVCSVHFTAQIRDCSKRFTINFNFFKPSSRYSLRRFFPTLSSKSAPQLPVCYHFEMQIKLSLQSRGLCVDSFPRWRPGPAEKPTPGATIPVKNTGFRAWWRFHPWIHMLRIFFASQLLDDRVDMTLWILTMTIVRNLEICQFTCNMFLD